MPVIAFASLSGAPGVTTTVTAWAAHTTQPTLIIEADLVGGSPILAGAMAGSRPHDRSILALAETLGALTDRLWEQAILLPETRDRWVVPTIAWAGQAPALAPIWPRLGQAAVSMARDGGMDVLIDLGRIRVGEGSWPLAAAADALLLFTDATLPAINTLAVGVDAIRERLSASGSPNRLAIVSLHAPSGADRAHIRPFTSAEIQAAVTPTVVLPPILYAPRDAVVYSAARPAPWRHRSSGYVRSVRQLTSAATSHAASITAALDA
jgi:hypothetical protein